MSGQLLDSYQVLRAWRMFLHKNHRPEEQEEDCFMDLIQQLKEIQRSQMIGWEKDAASCDWIKIDEKEQENSRAEILTGL